MILSVSFSKPSKDVEKILGKEYQKIKIKIENSGGKTSYFAQMFTQKQVFHKHFSEAELDDFIKDNAGTTFKNCVKITDSEEITIMANKKGKITTLTKAKKAVSKSDDGTEKCENCNNGDKSKNYILKEGEPVPFLVLLGIMNAQGKVIASRYDKFRQINRFLEFIDDVLKDVLVQKAKENDECIRIADFGCGKSYLTFAVHYFLTNIKKIPCKIEGLDLKEDVINYCNEITQKLSLENLVFKIGNIADYSGEKSPDIVVTLHACDTATDFALKYAVQNNAKAILSVPCCQHQINQQLGKNKISEESAFEPLLKWGIIREKFSSLVTDAIRGEWLESCGYKVQMLEFIDMEHTPKNILIRAVRKNDSCTDKKTGTESLVNQLGIAPEILK